MDSAPQTTLVPEDTYGLSIYALKRELERGTRLNVYVLRQIAISKWYTCHLLGLLPEYYVVYRSGTGRRRFPRCSSYSRRTVFPKSLCSLQIMMSSSSSSPQLLLYNVLGKLYPSPTMFKGIPSLCTTGKLVNMTSQTLDARSLRMFC